MVIQNIDVKHPCPAESDVPRQELANVPPFDRAAEEARMGNFELEDAFKNVLAVLGEDTEYNLDTLLDFNMNIE